MEFCDLRYDYNNAEDSDIIFQMLKSYNNAGSLSLPNPSFYFTTDGESVRNFSCTPENNGIYLWGGKISDSDFRALDNLYHEVADSIKIVKSSLNKFDPKLLVGNWSFLNNDSTNFPVYGNIQIGDNGECAGSVTGYSYVKYDNEVDYTPVFKIDKKFSGSWKLHNDYFSFDNDKTIKDSITCWIVMNSPIGQLDAISYFNEDYNKYPNYYDNRFKDYCGINNEFFIESVDKKRMIINDGCGNIYELIKSKNSHKRNGSNKQISDLQLVGNWMWEDTNSTEVISFSDLNKVSLSLMQPVTLGETDNKMGYVISKIDGNYRIDKNKVLFNFDESSLEQEFVSNEGDLGWQEYEDISEEFKRNLINSCTALDFTVTEVIDNNFKIANRAFSHIGDTYSLVFVDIPNPDSYAGKLGLSGNFVVMEWCDWNCMQTISEFKEEFEKQKDNDKRLILLPVSSDEYGRDIFGKPITLECPPGIMGFHLKDITVNVKAYLYNILSSYKILKAANP